MNDCENCLYKYSCELREIKESEDKCDDFEELKVKYVPCFHIKIPIVNQTFELAFHQYDVTLDTIYFYVSMILYTKRKSLDKNNNLVEATGLNPHLTLAAAAKCFPLLEKEVITRYNKYWNIVINICWEDNQRRDIYIRYLKRYGYIIGFDGKKCLQKKVKKGSAVND
jgi:hypothetical protein